MKHRTIDPIPASIVKAICSIQASVSAVEKSQTNQHGRYKFASTDDIYAAVTRKMGEVGLCIMPIEIHHEVVRFEVTGADGTSQTKQWLKATFGFILATADDSWEHPDAKRSLFIQITGPQTHQAAQSYAEKAFLRSLFKLPTGDMDLDSMPQAETEDGMAALNGNGKPRKSSAEGKRDGTVKKFNELRAEISAALSVEHLQHLREIHSDDGQPWAEMPVRWHETLEEDYSVKMDDLRALEAV